MPNLIGQSIGRYHILEQLGQGGMATVYRAYDTRLERPVAIKVIRREAFPPEQLERTLKRFEREAKALARLSHPNIVKVHDFGEYEGSPYVVMEYLPGGTLKGRMGQAIPWQEAAKLLIPVAQALHYAHQRGILHRDIKPSNILIAGTGEPMLTDFGIAKIIDTQETHTLTGTGVGIGTPEYMAPEQGLGQETDARADLYSLGIIFYELVTGRKPYTADTPMAVVIKHVNEPLPNPRLFSPDLPENVERMLLKALAKLPENRYPDMDAFAAALETLLGPDRHETVLALKQPAEERTLEAVGLPGAKPPSMESGPERQEKPAWHRWLPLGSVIGLVCIGLAAVAVFLLVKTANANRLRSSALNATKTWIADFVSGTPTHTSMAAPTNPPSLTPTPVITATPENPNPSPQDGMVMLPVPEGAFTMGSNSAPYPDEKPAHQVFLDAYWIDKFEVTNGMFLKFVTATGYITELEKQNLSWLFSGSKWYSVSAAGWRNPLGAGSFLDDRMDHPVVQVSWNDAQKYCAWAGRGLPTEAEWEKAARGAEANEYPWGNVAPSGNLANYAGKIGDTVPIGSYPGGASPYGALDMAGNVYEWVADWYSDNYYSVSPSSNPTGPSTGTHKVMRGGSWQLGAYPLHPYEREVSQPEFGNSNLGFRCAQSSLP
jgi:formylglycine-generating enzyme required for sulfatase activity/tRNA A-37 threonylcarbamoyl transferase component Bud32